MSGSTGTPGALSSAAAYHKGRLKIAFVLTATYMAAEIVGGVLSGSLALLSDAAHMGTDVLGLGMALAAIHFAQRPATAQRTYGTYRLEVLAALANGILLFGVAAYILYEAYRRFTEPSEVLGIPMLIVASVGLLVNLASFWLLAAGAKESLNVRGAFLEVLSDLLGSVGVIIAAIVVSLTGWTYVDPLIAALIGLFVLPRTYRLTAEAVRIILEIAPPGLDVDEMRRRMEAIDGVVAVNDLHVWTLTSGMETASAHVVVADGSDWASVLDAILSLLATDYGVTHSTIQCEPEGFRKLPVYL